MPILTRIPQTDGCAVFYDVGHDQDLGVSRLKVLTGYMDLEFSKTAAEGDMFLFCESLAPNDNDSAIVEHILDGAKCRLLQWFGEVQSGDFGTQRRRAVRDLHRGNLSLWAPSRSIFQASQHDTG